MHEHTVRKHRRMMLDLIPFAGGYLVLANLLCWIRLQIPRVTTVLPE